MEIESYDHVFFFASWLSCGPNLVDWVEQIREELESSVQNDKDIKNFTSVIFENLLGKPVASIKDLPVWNEDAIDQLLLPRGNTELHLVVAFEGLWDIDGFEELLVWDWVFHNVMYLF